MPRLPVSKRFNIRKEKVHGKYFKEYESNGRAEVIKQVASVISSQIIASNWI